MCDFLIIPKGPEFKITRQQFGHFFTNNFAQI